MVVIISGGMWPTYLKADRQREADNLRRQNANIYVIQVGDSFNRQDLQRLAGRPENVFYTRNYEGLQAQGRPVVETIVFGGLYYRMRCLIERSSVSKRRVFCNVCSIWGLLLAQPKIRNALCPKKVCFSCFLCQ